MRKLIKTILICLSLNAYSQQNDSLQRRSFLLTTGNGQQAMQIDGFIYRSYPQFKYVQKDPIYNKSELYYNGNDIVYFYDKNREPLPDDWIIWQVKIYTPTCVCE